jgi:hypothetical protein
LPLFSFSPSWITRSFCLSLSPWARYLLRCLFLSRTLRSLFSRSLILLFPFTHFLLRARAHSLTLSIRFLHPFSLLSIFFSRPLACALIFHLSLLPWHSSFLSCFLSTSLY